MGHVVIINGQAYSDPAEMPEEVRATYRKMAEKFEDKNANGIPDIFEGDEMGRLRSFSESHYVVNGKVYKSLEEMPPELRQLYEQVEALWNNKDAGLFGLLGNLNQLAKAATVYHQSGQPLPGVDTPLVMPSPAQPAPAQPLPPAQPPELVTMPGEGNFLGRLAAPLMGLFALLFCVSAGVAIWYFLR